MLRAGSRACAARTQILLLRQSDARLANFASSLNDALAGRLLNQFLQAFPNLVLRDGGLINNLVMVAWKQLRGAVWRQMAQGALEGLILIALTQFFID